MNSNLPAVKVEGYKVTRTLEISNPKDWNNQKVNVTVEIDFTGCDISQILEWASRAKSTELTKALKFCEFDYVKRLAQKGIFKRKAIEFGTGYVEPEKQLAQVKSTMGTMTPAQRAELIKQLSDTFL